MTTYAILHTKIEGPRPYWYQIETRSDLQKALHRARNDANEIAGKGPFSIIVKGGANAVAA